MDRGKRIPMREQPPEERRHNFLEVALGYTAEEAKLEASRCLQCVHPQCVAGCPVNINIPKFIGELANGDLEASMSTLLATSSLPAVCGRVCPQEEQCEKHCVMGIKNEPIAIGRLERYVADYAMANEKDDGGDAVKVRTGKKVAVVGGGPSGLAAASDLAKFNYQVTVYEAFHQFGGVLSYGIPEFRLPKSIVKREVERLRQLGVDLQKNVIIGKTIELDELFSMGYAAIYIASGAGLPKFLGIPGEALNGVYSANEYLTRINLMKAYKFPETPTPVKRARRVAVIGGGNVAMDAARCALRLGTEEVHLLYRRSEAEMPARAEEVHHAKDEGVIFDILTNPVEIIGNEEGWVTGIRCVKMELGEPDKSGRRRPIPIEGSEFVLDMDVIIMAIGNSPNPLIAAATPDLETQSWGGIVADEETGQTSLTHVYAGGDAVSGAATVILAMGAGKKAASAIHAELSK